LDDARARRRLEHRALSTSRLAVLADVGFTCPCCGYQGLTEPPYRFLPDVSATRGVDPPYARHFGDPSYEVCDCCGFEFGNDDEPGTGTPVPFELYLKAWIEAGCPWLSPDRRPQGWRLEEQLERAGIAP
jgi:hypothetical protein